MPTATAGLLRKRNRRGSSILITLAQRKREVRCRSTSASAAATHGSNPNGGPQRPRPLEAFLPALQSRFSQVAKSNNGVFPLFPSRLEAQLRSRWNPDDYTNKRAAVLIPLYANLEGTPSLLFTRRSAAVPNNPSEISFPGGHQEPGESLVETALREAREELLGPHAYDWWREDSADLVILGQATTLPSIAGTPVTPIVAVLLPAIANKDDLETIFPGDPNEVDDVFGLSLQQMYATEETHDLPEHRLLGKQRVGPRYPTDESDYVWGITAFMLRPLLHRVFQPVFQWPTKTTTSDHTNKSQNNEIDDNHLFVDFDRTPDP